MSSRAWALAAGILAGVCLLDAQDFRATLTGRVLDSAGADVPHATVRVINAGQSLQYEVSSAADDVSRRNSVASG